MCIVDYASFILKLSTLCILAVNHFFLFQLNAYIMLNKYIYHQLPPNMVSLKMV